MLIYLFGFKILIKMDIEQFQANHLLDFELENELASREISTSRCVADKRKILSKLLKKERDSPGSKINLENYNFDFNTEQSEINRSFNSITDAIIDFGDNGNIKDSAYQRIKSRIAHISNRINRLKLILSIPNKVPNDQLGDFLKFQTEAVATCLKLESDLDDCVKNSATVDNMTFGPPPPPVINVAAPVVSYNKMKPISEWGIKFNGDSKKVYSFIESITEVAQARRVTKDELYDAAIELFEGDAFIWYRHIRTLVRDWDSLIQLLKKDFLHGDINEDIWDQIKNKKQRRGESVAIYFAHLDNLFNRLSEPPTDNIKIHYIKKNLLPEYISLLALFETNTVTELYNHCKKLEEAEYLKNKGKAINQVSNLCENSELSNSKKPFSKPENQFSNPSTSSYSGKFVNRTSNFKSESKNLSNKNENQSRIFHNKIKSMSCWNCGLPNHTFHNCRAKKQVFCFKCGLSNFTKSNCINCSKND